MEGLLLVLPSLQELGTTSCAYKIQEHSAAQATVDTHHMELWPWRRHGTQLTGDRQYGTAGSDGALSLYIYIWAGLRLLVLSVYLRMGSTGGRSLTAICARPP
jgi:hypothetical protein